MKSAIFRKPLPYIALLFAHMVWGGNFVIAKVTLDEIPAMSLAFLRFAFACLLIAPFLLNIDKKYHTVKLDHFPKLILATTFLMGLSILFFYQGIQRTSAIDASVLSMLVPVYSLLGGWWFLKEKIYWVNLLGVFFGLLGAIAIIGVPLVFVEGAGFEKILGNFLLIGSGISFVVGAILAKQLMKYYHALTITSVGFLVASIIFFIPATIEYYNNPSWVNNISVLGVLGFLYISILATVTAMFLLNWGIEKVGVNQANLFHYIEPVIAATLAVPILGERISFSFIIGTCLVILGVYWGTLGKAEHHHSHHKAHRS